VDSESVTYHFVQVNDLWIVLSLRPHGEFQSKYMIETLEHLHGIGDSLLVICSFRFWNLFMYELWKPTISDCHFQPAEYDTYE
jgi:hypothetical protein